MSKKIKLYTTPICKFCDKVKAFFDSEGVEYEIVDVTIKPEYQDELKKVSGMLTVPVSFFKDNVVVGYHRSKLKELVEIYHASK